MPPARFRGADVAADLRGGAALGARHQGPHPVAHAARRHAALVPREGHRHPALQERPLAERGGDREDRRLGRQRGAARQPGRPAAAARLRRRGRMDHRRAGPHPGVGRGGGARFGARQVDLAGPRADRADRGPLRGGGRGARVQRRAAAAVERHGRRPLRLPPHDLQLAHPRRRGPGEFRALADPRGGPQRGRVPAGCGPPAVGRLGARPGDRAPARQRPRDPRAPEVRVQAAPEGLRAGAAAGPAAGRQRRGRRHQAGPARSAAPRLPRAGGPHQAGVVRAAPARARHPHVPGGHLGPQHRDAGLRGVRPQLGEAVHLRGRLRPAAAEGHDPAHHRLARHDGGQPQRGRPAQLVGRRAALGVEHVHRPRRVVRADRRAVRGGDRPAPRAAAAHEERPRDRLPAVPGRVPAAGRGGGRSERSAAARPGPPGQGP